MDDQNVEQELLADLLIYGTSFHKIVDGRKVRIDTRDVYIQPKRPTWYMRLWRWALVVWVKLVAKVVRLTHSASGEQK